MSGLAQRSDDPWLAALPAAVLYGAWAAYANQDGGLAGMGVAALLQGAASLLATRFGLYLLQCLGRRHGLAQRQAPLLVVLLLTAPMAALHWLSGTPHPLASVAPSFVIGWLYFALWAHRHRVAGKPAAPSRRPRSSRSPSAGSARILGAFLSAQGRAIAMLEILGKASSINVRKVLWTCAELDLPYRREDWGSGFRDTHAAEFLALNPNAMVPVLRDGELVLWESNSIIRYLANRYAGERLYPQQAAPRARVDQWLDWQASDLNRSWSYAFMSLVRQSPAHRDAAQVEASLRGWTGFMEILEGQLLRTGAYVAGETFSLADIAIGLSVNRWYETPFEHPSLPAVRAYYERLGARPGFLAHGRNGVP